MTPGWFYEYAVGLMFIVHTTKLQNIFVQQRCQIIQRYTYKLF